MAIERGSVSFCLEDLRDILPRNRDGERPSRRAVARWLAKHGVPTDDIGGRTIVWLSDLAEALPQVQRALELRRVA